MNTLTKRPGLAAVALASLLAACGGEPPEPEAAADEDAAQADDNIAQPLVDSLEKAKAVDQQVQQRKADVDAALEEAEGKSSDDD